MLQELMEYEGLKWQVKLGEHFVYPALLVIDYECWAYAYGMGKMHRKSRFLCDGDRLVAEFFRETWPILEANKPEQYIAKYESMVSRLTKSKQANKLFSTRKDIDTLNSEIRSYLTKILERRDYIWHTCPRCPSPPVA